jgi:hypothetical protein
MLVSGVHHVNVRETAQTFPILTPPRSLCNMLWNAIDGMKMWRLKPSPKITLTTQPTGEGSGPNSAAVSGAPTFIFCVANTHLNIVAATVQKAKGETRGPEAQGQEVSQGSRPARGMAMEVSTSTTNTVELRSTRGRSSFHGTRTLISCAQGALNVI